jgi:hypothetical protein
MYRFLNHTLNHALSFLTHAEPRVVNQNRPKGTTQPTRFMRSTHEPRGLPLCGSPQGDLTNPRVPECGQAEEAKASLATATSSQPTTRRECGACRHYVEIGAFPVGVGFCRLDPPSAAPMTRDEMSPCDKGLEA